MVDCEIVAKKFKLQLSYGIYFQTNTHGEKGMNPLIPLAMG